MQNSSSQALCTTLANKVHDTLKVLAEGRDRHVLLDYPNHWNIGDSAIWLGEADILHKLHGRNPDYVSHLRYPVEQVRKNIPDDGLIYLHGGGNFGDIWPHFQAYREAVIAHHPHMRIIQLPQSLHFGDAQAIERTKRVIAAHGDFHLLVRDHKSFEFAQREFDCNVELAPDSAFGINMDRFKRASTPNGIGCIFRADKEQRDDAEAGRALFGPAGSEDWQAAHRAMGLFEKGVMGAFMITPQQFTGQIAAKTFNALALNKVRAGFEQIDRHKVLVTDRLHGHIMSTLLGKPHVVIDNFYGKITNFIDAWGMDDVTLRAGSYDEAHQMSDQLLTQAG
jgi:exopolysaccharide biosynthesis predicted pyruvyltransferase EpsI